MSCNICKREDMREGFCERHLRAYENLVNKFAVWNKAMGISWKEYLSQVVENSSTGAWVREVAKYLNENEETQCQKK